VAQSVPTTADSFPDVGKFSDTTPCSFIFTPVRILRLTKRSVYSTVTKTRSWPL